MHPIFPGGDGENAPEPLLVVSGSEKLSRIRQGYFDICLGQGLAWMR